MEQWPQKGAGKYEDSEDSEESEESEVSSQGTESSQEETESLEPWSRIFDEAEKRHETQLNALISEYCTVPQMIPNRKWSRDRKRSPKWTANDPRPQVIPKVDRKWSRENLRNGMDFVGLITKKDW